MVQNTIIGTGGDMSQIHRTALNEKIETKHMNLVGIGAPIIVADTNENQAQIIVNTQDTVLNITILDAPLVNRTVNIFTGIIPVIESVTEESIHQYATLTTSCAAIDVATSHIEGE